MQPREITLDPRQEADTDEEKNLLDLLLKQHDKNGKNHVPKNMSTGERGKRKKEDMMAKGEPYAIKHKSEAFEIRLLYSLVKFKHGYYVINDELLAANDVSKVKTVPIYYRMGSDQKYHAEKVSPTVIKILKLSRNSPMFKLLRNIYLDEFQKLEKVEGTKIAFDFLWQKYVEAAVHEHQMLVAAGDRNAEIVVDDTNHTIYFKSSKVPGKSLNEYLAAHPKLTFNRRLHLIKLVKNAIQDLHDKNIGHLDLKLENIFYDEATDQIRIIDYGSSQNIKVEGRDSTLGERHLPDYRHRTTAWLDPKDHNENTSSEIDRYSFAGVCGLILSDWSVEEGAQPKKWYELPLFNTKNQNADGPLLPDESEKRKYDFDELKKVKYLVGNESEQMSAVADELKKLGHEEKKDRITIDSFEEGLIKKVPVYANLIDVPMTTALKNLNPGHFEKLQRALNFLIEKEGSTAPIIATSEKPKVHYLYMVLKGLHDRNNCDKSMKTILEEALRESIEKQKGLSPKLFKNIPRMGGSNVLGELLSLPPEVKKYLDPKLLEEAHKYSENIGMRVVHGIQTKVGKALTRSKE